MKAVLDTNIFISGIFWKGSSNRVIANWREGKFILVTSLKAVSEIIKVLKDFNTLKFHQFYDWWKNSGGICLVKNHH